MNSRSTARLSISLAAYRADAAAAPGAAAWFHTVPPPGEYPGGRIVCEGRPVAGAVLVIDREAYDRILAAFRADAAAPGFRGLLVDREHFSLDAGKPSDAMAWAVDIREEADGLWTRWEFTPPGRELWEGGVLVRRSPVLALERISGRRFRPVRLDSVAMTNAPHFDLSPLAAARAAEEDPHTKGDPKMKRLLALLGLPETATEDEAATALQALIDKTAEAEQAKREAEQAKEEAEQAKEEAEQTAETAQAAARKLRCDAFIAAHRDRITDEAAMRRAYESAPEATEAAFALVKDPTPAAPARRITATAARPPADAAVSLAAYRAMRPGPEKDAYLAAHKATLLRLESEETQNK